MNLRAAKTNYMKYILDVNMSHIEENTPVDRVIFLMRESFESAMKDEFSRRGRRFAADYWLRGLSLDIDYTNHQIIKRGLKYGAIEHSSNELEKAHFIEIYRSMMAGCFLELIDLRTTRAVSVINKYREMQKNDIIEAKPLEIEALDTQIIKAGGLGFNADVNSERIPYSFSYIYTFPTKDGWKRIKTPNQIQCGIIDDVTTKFVIYDANRAMYTLIEKKENKKLLITDIGKSFGDAMDKLRELYPNRIRFNIKSHEDLENEL